MALEEWISFYEQIEQSQLTEQAKMSQLLDKFNKISETGNDFTEFRAAAFDIISFFSNNPNLDKKWLLNGFEDYLTVIDQNLSKFMDEDSFSKFRVQLQVNEWPVAFRKSLKFRQLMQKLMSMMKPKNRKDSENFFEDLEILHKTKDGSYVSLNESYRRGRFLINEKLMCLQEKHDSLERDGNCQANEKQLHLYLEELLIATNFAFSKGLIYSDPNYTLILENTKTEITRLLKCLFGITFKTRTCNHATGQVKLLSRGVAEKILTFYLSDDTHVYDSSNKKMDTELVEICQKMRSMIEQPLTGKVKEAFDNYFEKVSKFKPDCKALDGEMQDLSQIYNKFDVLNSPQAEITLKEIRLTLTKACYVLAHEAFQTNDPKASLMFKKVLMLGQHVMDKKLAAKVWLFIAKCMAKTIANQSFNLGMFDNVLSPFYMSLLLDKKNAETHVCLAVTLYRLHSFHKKFFGTNLPINPKHRQMSEALLYRFKIHLNFASTYIKKETDIIHVCSVTYPLLMAIEKNYVTLSNTFVKNVISIFTYHLTGLITAQIKNPTVNTDKFIEMTHKQLLVLNEKMKKLNLLPNEEEFHSMIENVKKAWVDLNNKFKEKISPKNQKPSLILNLSTKQTKVENQQTTSINPASSSDKSDEQMEVDSQLPSPPDNNLQPTSPDQLPSPTANNIQSENQSTSPDQLPLSPISNTQPITQNQQRQSQTFDQTFVSGRLVIDEETMDQSLMYVTADQSQLEMDSQSNSQKEASFQTANGDETLDDQNLSQSTIVDNQDQNVLPASNESTDQDKTIRPTISSQIAKDFYSDLAIKEQRVLAVKERLSQEITESQTSVQEPMSQQNDSTNQNDTNKNDSIDQNTQQNESKKTAMGVNSLSPQSSSPSQQNDSGIQDQPLSQEPNFQPSHTDQNSLSNNETSPQQNPIISQSTSTAQNLDDEDEITRLTLQLEEQKKKSDQIRDRYNEAKKREHEFELQILEKKFNKRNTELEVKNAELQAQVEKLIAKRAQLIKDNEVSSEKVKEIMKENAELRQTLEEKLREEQKEEENYIRMKRRHEEEEERLRNAKRARRTSIYDHLVNNSFGQINDSGRGSIQD